MDLAQTDKNFKTLWLFLRSPYMQGLLGNGQCPDRDVIKMGEHAQMNYPAASGRGTKKHWKQDAPSGGESNPEGLKATGALKYSLELADTPRSKLVTDLDLGFRLKSLPFTYLSS